MADRFDVDELLATRTRRDLRRLPALVGQSVRLVSAAGRGDFRLAIALQLVGAASAAAQVLLSAGLLREIIESTEERPDLSGAARPLLLLTVVTAVAAFVNLVRNEHQRVLAELVSRYAMGLVLDVSTSVELIEFERPGFHDRLQRAVVNAQMRPLQLASGVIGLAGSGFTVAAIGVALFALEPLLLALVLVAYVPAWLASRRMSRTSYEFAHAQTERDRRRLYLGALLSSKEEAKELRAFGSGPFLRGRYDQLFDERIGELRRAARSRGRAGLLGAASSTIATAGILALLVWLVESGRTPLSAAAAAAAATAMLGTRLQALASSAGNLYESSLFVEDFTSFLELDHRLAGRAAPAEAPRSFERIRVDGVSFTYPSARAPALSNVTLEIGVGQRVALVGENGSGKTTLAKLLCGLYAPEHGSIAWDGVDLATIDADELRRSISVLFQDFTRYHLSVRENVALGDVARYDDHEAVTAAAVAAGIDSAVQSLTSGYDTNLGPEFFGGTDLSGGQWQRVALARVFFRGANLLVLDEPTSALDARAEAALFASLAELASGRTVVFVSHRFSTVRDADQIFVLDAGRVTERGTHDELIAEGGTYASMYELQASPYRS